MPSPFPGMDPFLEHPDYFPGLHDELIIYSREALQPRLPEPYFAKTSQRVWVEVSERFIEPDVEVLRRNHDQATSTGSAGGAGVAVASRTEPVIVIVPALPDDEYREPFAEIYAWQGSDKRLVTSIEVLSLSNKTRGRKGRQLYSRKQSELLESNVNLVEIDLLRGGEHTTAVPLDLAVAIAGSFDYHVSVHRGDEPDKFSVYPIQMAQRLPEIAIPLLPGDSPVAIDLQAVFDRCYDTGSYRREVRYDEDTIVPPLSAAQVPWASKVLQATLANQ